MKSDLAMYIIAIVCFILAAVTVSGVFGGGLSVYTVSIAFAALGIIFLGVGYTLRPKIEKPAFLTKAKPEEAKIEEVEAPKPTTPTEAPEPVAPEITETVTTAQPSPAEAQVQEARAGLTDVKGIGPKRAEQLNRLGIYTLYDLSEADAEDLAKKTELSPKITRRWVEEARNQVTKT